MIKISIIVPVYNVEEYLPKCLDSLINQTLKDIEIICINDGSTDSSGEILEKYSKKDSRLKVITQSNQGVSAARNNGVEIAKGEYIGFVDSDDWVDADFYEKLYTTAKQYSADIAAADMVRVKHGKIRKFFNFNETRISDNFIEKLKLCNAPDFSYTCNKIYKTDAVKKNNLRFEHGMNYEDIIYTAQALYYLNKLVTVPGTNYYYFSRKNSIIHSKGNTEDYQKAIEYVKNFLKSHNAPLDEVMTQVKTYNLLKLVRVKIKRKNNKTKIRINKGWG